MANPGGLGALANLMDYSDEETESQTTSTEETKVGEVKTEPIEAIGVEDATNSGFVIDRFLTPEDMIQSLLSDIVLGEVMERASAEVRILSAPLSASFRNTYRGSAHKGRGHSEDSDSGTSSSDSDSSSDDSDAPKVSMKSSDDEHESNKKQEDREKRDRERMMRAKDVEIELPAIEDLQISVEEKEAMQIGTISSIVDDLVVVKALPGIPALDFDSVLFLDHGFRSLGRVFDIFGPVGTPYYSVRFNSRDHIRSKDILKGMEVFYAPRTEHASFVFVEQLRRLKGSDASWEDDSEVPPHKIDFSDDEDERAAKKAWKEKKAKEKQVELGVGAANYDAIPNKKPRPNNKGANNAFYRTNKRFSSRANGPIRWDSVQAPNVSVPPPPMHQYQQAPPHALFQQSNPMAGYQNPYGYLPGGQVNSEPGPSGYAQPPPTNYHYSNHAFRYPPPPPPPPGT